MNLNLVTLIFRLLILLFLAGSFVLDYWTRENEKRMAAGKDDIIRSMQRTIATQKLTINIQQKALGPDPGLQRNAASASDIEKEGC